LRDRGKLTAGETRSGSARPAASALRSKSAGARRARSRARRPTASRGVPQHGADETINYATEDLRERIGG
jgi:hypothetical protein